MIPPTASNFAIMTHVIKVSVWVSLAIFGTDRNAEMFVGPITLTSVASNLLTTRTDIEAQNLWMGLAYHKDRCTLLYASPNVYLA